MSRGPYLLATQRWGARLGNIEVVDYTLGILQDPFERIHMGITADVAQRYEIDREAQNGLAPASLLKSLANVEVLAIDELGYVNIKPEQTNIFFKLMEERHHRKPTLITTNLPYANWPDFLANPALTKALLSRLRERCHTVTIEGPCIRPQTG